VKNARYNYRVYPTPEQERQLVREFGCARFVYNWGHRLTLDGLEELNSLGDFESKKARTQAFKQHVPSYVDLAKKLTLLKKEEATSFLTEVSIDQLQQSLRHLDSAWKKCFIKKSQRPRFKKKQQKQSISYTRNAFRFRDGEFFVAKLKDPIEVRWTRKLPSEPKTATLSKDPAGRYFVSFTVELEPETLPPTTKTVGLDLGPSHFLVTSEGEKVENPRLLQQDLKKLATAQRRLAKKKKGSRNREKARAKVARLHARIADKRRDFLQQLSTRLVRENQAIGIENLAVRNMVKNKKLSRAISDVGWGAFVRMLEYKADWYGREVVKIDRWFPSSKTCSSCGDALESLPLSMREWQCPSCGETHDRDINAALNLQRAAGLAVQACGENHRCAEGRSPLFASGFYEAGSSSL
jgi:putative transposase